MQKLPEWVHSHITLPTTMDILPAMYLTTGKVKD